MRVWQAMLRDRLAMLGIGRSRTVRLAPPRLYEISLPDMLLLRSQGREIVALKEEAAQRAADDSELLAPMARSATAFVVPIVRNSDFASVLNAPEIAEGQHGAIAFAAGIGIALSIVEAERRWQRPGLTDARVHTALAMIHTGSDESGAKAVTNFAARVGYWLARTGEEGVTALPSEP